MKNHGFRRLPPGLVWVLVAHLGPGAVAQESLAWGGRVEEGRLSVLEGSWSSEDADARWWWRSEDPGAGWVRWRGLQVGPLVAAQAPEGERAWRPANRVSSGYWGLDADLGLVEVWGVQTPEDFEAGVLGRWNPGPWSFATGVDRTWALDGGSWVDRFRLGGGWSGNALAAGWEGVGGLTALGQKSWTTRARVAGGVGPWSWGLRLRAADHPSEDGWSLLARAGYQGWWVGWTGTEGTTRGTSSLGWGHRGHEIELDIGDTSGVSGRTEINFAGVEVGAKASTEGPPWAYQGELWFAPPRGGWRLGWELKSGDPPVQTFSGRWRQERMEVEVSWKVEGFALGWVGPQSGFTLSWRWES